MEINGLKLPNSFVEAISKGIFNREIGSWLLKQEIDAYGNHFEAGLGELYKSEDLIAKETKLLTEHFTPNDYYGKSNEWENEPGFISDIVDFSKIVCFGMSGDGAPYCFDFRDEAENPSIIWWDDVYWRRVAPDFEHFVALINLKS